MKQVLLAITCLCVMINVTFTSSAQEITWEQTNGPSGGNPNNFLAGPDGLVFASYREYENSELVYAIYRSVDYGNNWDRLELQGENAYVVGVSDLGHVFAGVDGDFYRSTDKGDTWSLISVPSNSAINNILQGNGNTLYSGSSDLLYSVDDGQTWILSDTTESFLLDVNSQGHLYRVANQQLQLSTDNGFEWTVVNDLDFISTVEVLVINKNDEILVGGVGLFKISPDGSLHEQVSDGVLFEQLVASPSGTIIGRVYLLNTIISYDDGDTWDYIGNRIPGHFEYVFYASVDSILYVSTPEGIYRSDDDGNTWVEAHGGIYHAHMVAIASDLPGNIYVITDTRLLKKDSESDTWQTVYHANYDEYFSDLRVYPSGEIYLITYQQSWDKSTIEPCFSGTCNRLYRSTDGAQTWELLYSSASLTHFEIDSSGDMYISSSYGLMKSDDNGETWEQVFEEGFLEIYLGGNGELMYAQNWDGFFRTDDQGLSWTGFTIPGFGMFDLTVNSAGDIFVISTVTDENDNLHTLLKSSDRGNTWERIAPVQGDVTFTKLYLGKYDILYIFSNRGMYRSLDNGVTWQDLSSQLVVLDVTSDGNGNLYAAASNGGVWRSATFVPVNKIPLARDRMHVYPNPTSGTIQVSYQGAAYGTDLRIYNNKGQLIKKVALTSSTATIDISNLTPGIYLFKAGDGMGKVIVN